VDWNEVKKIFKEKVADYDKKSDEADYFNIVLGSTSYADCASKLLKLQEKTEEGHYITALYTFLDSLEKTNKEVMKKYDYYYWKDWKKDYVKGVIRFDRLQDALSCAFNDIKRELTQPIAITDGWKVTLFNYEIMDLWEKWGKKW